MTPIDTARSREPASRPSEDFTRAALSFVHEMVTQAEQTPLKLESQLSKLALALLARGRGPAHLAERRAVGSAPCRACLCTPDHRTVARRALEFLAGKSQTARAAGECRPGGGQTGARFQQRPDRHSRLCGALP